MIRPAAVLAFAAGPALAEPSVPTFTDETATAGLTTVYEGDWEYMVGGKCQDGCGADHASVLRAAA
jgi:enediyne biosynthesis protein E4